MKKEFIENYLFEIFKDSAFKGSGEFKRVLKDFIDIDYTRLYTRIVNYQVKKYGTNLHRSSGILSLYKKKGMAK